MPTPQEILQASEAAAQSLQNLYNQFPQLTRNLESVRNALLEIQRTERDIIKQVEIRQDLEQNTLDTYKTIRDYARQRYETELKKREVANDELRRLQIQLDIVNETIRINGPLLEWTRKRQKIENDILMQTQKINVLNSINLTNLQQTFEQRDGEYQAVVRTHNQLKSVAETQKNMIKTGQENMKSWFKLRNSSFDFLKNVGNISEAMGHITFRLRNMVRGMASMVNTATILARIFDSTKELVKSLEEQSAITASITGRQRQYTAELLDAAVATREFSQTLSETAPIWNSLYTNMTRFSEITPQARKELTFVASGLNVLGVSADTTSGILDNLTLALRMTVDRSKDTVVGITNLAKTLGITINQMQTQFASALPQLSVYGDKAIDVFKGLAAASKATGVGVDRLNQIFGRSLDTFEGSAEVAGRLNSILGQDLLNSVDLLYASEDQRVRMIKQSIAASGVQWQNLNKFHKMAIATAAGIEDMSEANKIFGLSMNEYDQMQLKAKLAESKQKDFNESIKASVTFMKKLEVAFQNLAIAVQPIVWVLGIVVDIFSTMMNWFGKFTNEIGPALSVLFIGLSVIVYKLAAGVVLSAQALTGFSIASTTAAGATATVGAAAATSTGFFGGLAASLYAAAAGMWAFLAPILAGVAAIAVLGAAIYGLYRLFHKSGSPQFWELPKYTAVYMDDYNEAIKTTTPNIEKLTRKSEVLHKVQTKRSSPALWEMPSVLAKSTREYNQEITNLQPQINRLTEANKNFHSSTKQTSVTTTQNTTTINTSTASKTPKRTEVSVNVSFLDIEATKRSFREAVIKAIEEQYA